jgi:uncharacterized protein YcnI
MSTTPRVRRWRRVITTVSLTAIALVAGAGVAAAHVTVNPGEAAAGDFTKLTFRVPNESPTAGTTAVTVTIPADHPFAFVSVKAIPGWSVTPTKTTLPAPVTEGDTTIKEAVTSVTWTADPGTQIGPGEFGEFDISAGPVPDVPSIAFTATQTYSDGSVVEWNEPTPASGEEPEHPAPTLTIGAAAAGEEGHSHSDTDAAATTSAEATSSFIEPAGVEPVTTVAATTTTETSSAPTIIAVVSLVIAAGALLVAAFALRRKPGGPTNPPAAG